MKYLSWAAFYEGNSDALYLDVLLPRILRELITAHGEDLVDVPDVPAVRLGQNGRTIEAVAAEACAFREAFDLVFIHADTGGRALERNIDNRSQAYCDAMQAACGWPTDQCITLTPRHETEAWLLADATAITSALGYQGDPSEVGLPSNAKAAERLIDPKATLKASIEQISGRRRRQPIENSFPAIGQRQRMDALRASSSFQSFETRLRIALTAMRLIS